SLAELDADLDRARKKMDETRKRMGAFTNDAVKLAEMIEQLGQLADPREQSRRRAAFIMRVHEGVVAEFRRRGVRKPGALAWKKLAERHGHNSGPALKKWVNRHR